MLRKLVTVTLAAAVASLASFGAPATPARAAGEAVVSAGSACQGTDASAADWSWTKPTLEVSTNSGSSYAVADTSSAWRIVACRESGSRKMYWFGVRAASAPTSEDLGAAGLAAGLQFRITIAAKPGDTMSSLAGYSDMVSFVESSGTATVVTKAVGFSKVDYGSMSTQADLTAFLARHPECAGLSMNDLMKCSITKADRDLTAAVIQHIMYTDTTPSSMDTLMKGMWVGAAVNSFQMAMTCNNPVTAQRVPAADVPPTVNLGGKTYTNISGTTNYLGPDGKTYTMQELQALGGGQGGSSGGTSSVPASFTVTMSGAPHLKSDGVTLNKGSMKVFITESVAKRCFGNSQGTSTLDEIAKALSMERVETKEGTTKPPFTPTAVTSPVAGILITVSEITFSNPEYTIKSTLSAYLAGAGGSTSGGTTTGGTTTGGTTTGGPASSSTASYKIVKKGSKATITIVLVAATTVKIYRKTSSKSVAKLAKTLKGKKGKNTYATTWKKGYVYIVRSSKGTTLATLK
ncbi:MAG: hypothetical protein ACO36A_04500 [Ilumatobacteraceae bacterium]